MLSDKADSSDALLVVVEELLFVMRDIQLHSAAGIYAERIVRLEKMLTKLKAEKARNGVA